MWILLRAIIRLGHRLPRPKYHFFAREWAFSAYLFEISRFPIDAKVFPLFFFRSSCARRMNSSRTGTTSALSLTIFLSSTTIFLSSTGIADRPIIRDAGMSGCVSLDQIRDKGFSRMNLLLHGRAKPIHKLAKRTQRLPNDRLKIERISFAIGLNLLL
jgi:hypothetical protein